MLLVAACLTPLYLYQDFIIISINIIFFEILKIFTFDFWGRRVGGDGDFFDFEWEPDRSLCADKIEMNPKKWEEIFQKNLRYESQTKLR